MSSEQGRGGMVELHYTRGTPVRTLDTGDGRLVANVPVLDLAPGPGREAEQAAGSVTRSQSPRS